MNSRSEEILAIRQLIGAAFFYSLFSVFSRLMGDQFGSFFQAWSRAIPTLITLLLIGFIQKSFSKINARDYPWFIVVGLAGALVSVPFYVASVHMSIGMTMFIFYAASTVLTYGFGSVVFHEYLTKAKIISIFLALVGLSLMYHDSLQTAKFFYMSMAALAGMLFSIYASFSKKLSHEYSSVQVNVLDYIFTILSCLPLSLFLKESFNFHLWSTGWLWNILYSFATVGAVILTVEGFKHTDAQKGSIYLLSELLFVLFFGFILFGEIPPTHSLFGGLFVAAALVLPNISSKNGRLFSGIAKGTRR